ncbi:MAG: hypothetical protein AAGK00_19375 [Pseudomonadota bacterium]
MGFLACLGLFACTPAPAPEAASSAVAQISPERSAALGSAYEALSPGDKSTLDALLDDPEASLLTVAGSANDAFWTLLVAEGWGRPVEVEAQILEALPAARGFGFAPGGRDKAAEWLRNHKAQQPI